MVFTALCKFTVCSWIVAGLLCTHADPEVQAYKQGRFLCNSQLQYKLMCLYATSLHRFSACTRIRLVCDAGFHPMTIHYFISLLSLQGCALFGPYLIILELLGGEKVKFICLRYDHTSYVEKHRGCEPLRLGQATCIGKRNEKDFTLSLFNMTWLTLWLTAVHVCDLFLLSLSFCLSLPC